MRTAKLRRRQNEMTKARYLELRQPVEQSGTYPTLKSPDLFVIALSSLWKAE